jgi:hypothetical protein
LLTQALCDRDTIGCGMTKPAMQALQVMVEAFFVRYTRITVDNIKRSTLNDGDVRRASLLFQASTGSSGAIPSDITLPKKMGVSAIKSKGPCRLTKAACGELQNLYVAILHAHLKTLRTATLGGKARLRTEDVLKVVFAWSA